MASLSLSLSNLSASEPLLLLVVTGRDEVTPAVTVVAAAVAIAAASFSMLVVEGQAAELQGNG